MLIRSKNSNNQVSNIAINLFSSEPQDTNIVLFGKGCISFLIMLLLTMMPIDSITLNCQIIVRQIEVNPIFPKSLFPFVGYAQFFEALFHYCLNICTVLFSYLLKEGGKTRLLFRKFAIITAINLWSMAWPKFDMAVQALSIWKTVSLSIALMRAVFSGSSKLCRKLLSAILANVISQRERLDIRVSSFISCPTFFRAMKED